MKIIWGERRGVRKILQLGMGVYENKVMTCYILLGSKLTQDLLVRLMQSVFVIVTPNEGLAPILLFE